MDVGTIVTMALEYSFIDTVSYLLVRASGRLDNAEVSRTFINAIMDEAKATGQTRILIDECEVIHALSLVTILSDIKFILSRVPRPHKVAIIGNEESSKQHQFYKGFSFDTGLQVEIFTDIIEAENWLME